MASAGKFNLRNPAVKRILQEMKEMQQDSSLEFVAEALEDNIFEWHFVIRGPPDTEFEGGLYHGRILLPTDYPFKPPSFVMLTPSGRFEVGKKICLSISERHPEHWQPSWSMRTALMALVAFLPTKGKGAIGSLDFPEADRRVMAKKSRTFIPSFVNEERQNVATVVHNRALEREWDNAAKKRWAAARKDKAEDSGKENGLATVSSDASQDPAETIKTATDIRSESASLEQAHHPLADNVPEQAINEPTRTTSNTSIPSTPVTPAWITGPGVEGMDARVEHLQGEVGDREWMWSAAMWAIGFVIIALVAKKMLVRAGVDVWAFIE